MEHLPKGMTPITLDDEPLQPKLIRLNSSNYIAAITKALQKVPGVKIRHLKVDEQEGCMPEIELLLTIESAEE